MTPYSGSRRRVGRRRRGERRGVWGGHEEAQQLQVEVEVEVELEDAEEVEELEHGLPVAAPVDVGDTVDNSFTKAVQNSSVHKSVHNSFMTGVSVLQWPNYERNMDATDSIPLGPASPSGSPQAASSSWRHPWIGEQQDNWVAEGVWVKGAGGVEPRSEAAVPAVVCGVL